MPDVEPTTADTGRHCDRVLPSTPNPHHSRPWHRGSLFGDGPRRALSYDQRRAWKARVDAERHAGNLPAEQANVAHALLKRLGKDGQCDPSYATLAADSGTSQRTVGRAVNRLHELKLLAWERRLVRRTWPAGGRGAQRAEQTSNAYELLLPTGPLAPRERRPVQVCLLLPHCGSQDGREIPSEMISRGLPTLSEAERRELDTLLAARKARRDAEWMAQRAEQWRKWGWLPQ